MESDAGNCTRYPDLTAAAADVRKRRIDCEQRRRISRAPHAQEGAFIIPNPWDPGTARILAALGFPALATTSAGMAFALGVPEGRVSREATLAGRSRHRRGDRSSGVGRSGKGIRR